MNLIKKYRELRRELRRAKEPHDVKMATERLEKLVLELTPAQRKQLQEEYRNVP